MTETLDALKNYWWLITGPIAFAFGGAFLWLKSQFATKQEFKAQAAHVNAAIGKLSKNFEDHADETEGRLTRLETVTEHLPTREAFHELTLQVERQGAMIEAMRDTQKATAAGVSRIEEFMIKGSGK